MQQDHARYENHSSSKHPSGCEGQLADAERQRDEDKVWLHHLALAASVDRLDVFEGVCSSVRVPTNDPGWRQSLLAPTATRRNSPLSASSSRPAASERRGNGPPRW